MLRTTKNEKLSTWTDPVSTKTYLCENDNKKTEIDRTTGRYLKTDHLDPMKWLMQTVKHLSGE